MELDNTEVDSTEIKNNPSPKVYNKNFPNIFKLRNISFISRLSLLMFIRYKKAIEKINDDIRNKSQVSRPPIFINIEE